jgi:predicted PurR-regulated permease PerM
MKKLTLILFVVPVFFIMSCASALQVTDIDSWLTTKAAGTNAAINITGTWKDALNETDSFMSWGQGELTQTGNTITGNISTYVIKGIVSGKTVYLVLYNGTRVDYTAKFELKNNNELYGDYYSSRDTNQTAPTPMSFKKVK